MLSTKPDKIVSFGDSLSDGGAIFGVTDQLFRVALPLGDDFVDPAYVGVWSNGPVHAQILPNLLGAEGLPYGVGSAQAVGERRLSDLVGSEFDILKRRGLDDDLEEALEEFELFFRGQVDRFLAEESPWPNGPDPSVDVSDEVAAAVYIGNNDIGAFATRVNEGRADPSEAPAFLASVVTAIGEGVADILSDDRVDSLLLYTMPAIDFFPLPEGATPENVAAVNGLIDEFRKGLADLSKQVARDTGKETELIRLDLMGREVSGDMATFGFSAKGPFYEGSGTDPNIEGFNIFTGEVDLSFDTNPDVEGVRLDRIMFFDDVHFSAELHEITAAWTEAQATSRFRDLAGGNDRVKTKAVDDFLLLGNGKDRAVTSGGDDLVFGGAGNDTAKGGNGDDILVGGLGRDLLEGGNGVDLLVGGVGNDTSKGGAGNDLFVEIGGTDVLEGEGGRDAFVWIDPGLTDVPDRGTDLVNGGRGRDALHIVTDADGAAAALAAIEEAGGRRVVIPELGLDIRNVERLFVHDGGLDDVADPSGLAGANRGLLADADLWGFI